MRCLLLFYIVQNRGLHFAFEFAIIIQNKYCVLIKCTKGESLAALPLVCQLVVHLNRISNFQLIFLIALPASRAFIIARNTFFHLLAVPGSELEIGKRACAVARRLHSPLEVGRVRQVKGEKQKVCNKA